jgi:hypothetical protein
LYSVIPSPSHIYNSLTLSVDIYFADTLLFVGGAFLGSLVVFSVTEAMGTRREMLLAALLFVCGALVEALAATSSLSAGAGEGILLLGRWTYGIGCGFAMHGMKCARGTSTRGLCNPHNCCLSSNHNAMDFSCAIHTIYHHIIDARASC